MSPLCHRTYQRPRRIRVWAPFSDLSLVTVFYYIICLCISKVLIKLIGIRLNKSDGDNDPSFPDISEINLILFYGIKKLFAKTFSLCK